jgi:hypothetical protein
LNYAKDKGFDFIWRCDDDCVPDPTSLWELWQTINLRESIGAVGGLIKIPGVTMECPPIATNKIEDVHLMLNLQWFEWNKRRTQVDQLAGIFLHRVEAAEEYNRNLSPLGHTEETQFTYQMKRAGYEIIVEPRSLTWHYRNPEGGIRDFRDSKLLELDKLIFRAKLNEWGVKLTKYKLIILNNGIGDHCCFLSVYDKIRERSGECKIILAAHHKEVIDAFSDKLKGDEIRIEMEIAFIMDDTNNYNVYTYMMNHPGTTMQRAYLEMYANEYCYSAI